MGFISSSWIFAILINIHLAVGHEGTTTFQFPAAATSVFVSQPTTLPLNKNSSYPFLGSTHSSVNCPLSPKFKHCIITPLGWGRDDSSQILAAVDKCGTNGIITLPAPFVFIISRRMYMTLVNAKLEIFGTLSFSPDLLYWIDQSFRVEFQNQSTAWIVEGSNFEIDGGGWDKGGIDGNGQAWMTRAAGQSNQFGRPISLSIYNSSDVVVRDFTIRQPQFWSFWVQNSARIKILGVHINGTNTDPQGNSTNYETNIDGLDSLRVDDLEVADMLFRGGDDCMAPKGNSTNLVFRNLTCIGGGIAFGSLGQYVDSPDYINNVTATDITVKQDIKPNTGGASVAGGAYFKSWVGKAEGQPPQGGGGGTGKVSNVTFKGLHVDNTTNAVYINKCYHKVADQANYCDTSTLSFVNLSFQNISGSVSGSVGIALNCSAAAPCSGIQLTDVHLQSTKNVSVILTCDNVDSIDGYKCNSTLSS